MMTISPNKIMGSIVCRTSESLALDPGYRRSFAAYRAALGSQADSSIEIGLYPINEYELPGLLRYLAGGVSQEQHLNGGPGMDTGSTVPDVGTAFIEANAGNNAAGCPTPGPSVLNLQNVVQEKNAGETTITFSLAIVAPVPEQWTSAEREQSAFEAILRPVYQELMRQVNGCGYFESNYGTPSHRYAEIFTAAIPSLSASNDLDQFTSLSFQGGNPLFSSDASTGCPADLPFSSDVTSDCCSKNGAEATRTYSNGYRTTGYEYGWPFKAGFQAGNWLTGMSAGRCDCGSAPDPVLRYGPGFAVIGIRELTLTLKTAVAVKNYELIKSQYESVTRNIKNI